jgi:1-acyl-sn-glycerol-3-phosphate acyltransferase
MVIPQYFGQIEVVGQENLPPEGAVILAPTHRSRWDSILVAAVTGRTVSGRDLRFMVTADEVQGIQGYLIRHLGGFPVDLRRPTVASLRYGVDLLLNQEMLVIFPEGGIFREQHVQPLKPGLARLALQAESSQPGLGVKVVPISIQYSQLLPRWGCDVQISIGKPIEVAPYNKGKGKQDARHLTSDLEIALRNLSIGAVNLEQLAYSSR